ncbi:MAG: signal recognition particle protein, partial [Erysipelotrichaceae bacterium]
QLQIWGDRNGIPVVAQGHGADSASVIFDAFESARAKGIDVLIADTAGRLHIDEELMQELSDIKAYVKPDDILLTVDAMTGQDIVNVAQSFHDQLEVTGLVLTKLDGDARGGGVLSVRAITQVPVKFVGLGEKIDDLDIFYPTRMADRILGMGDIMTLVEQAQDKMDLEAGERSAKRMMQGIFTLQDMLEQFQQIKKMGSFSSMMKLIPGMGQMAGQINEAKSDDQMKKFEAIILSMTKEERENPTILKASRKNRIAAGSGCKVLELNQLLSRYEKTKMAMKQMTSMAKSGGLPNQMKGMSKLKPRNG